MLHLDLTKSLLVLLEFMCTHVPSAFLTRECSLNLTRTLEVGGCACACERGGCSVLFVVFCFVCILLVACAEVCVRREREGEGAYIYAQVYFC